VAPGARNKQHPNWGGASRGQGPKTQAQRWGKPKIGKNNLQNHYFSRQVVEMDEETTIKMHNPGDEDNNMEEAETVKPGDDENLEEAKLRLPDHAWHRDHALSHDPNDESHQDEEACTRNRDKFSGLLQEQMAKFTNQDYQQEANALVAKGHLIRHYKAWRVNQKKRVSIAVAASSAVVRSLRHNTGVRVPRDFEAQVIPVEPQQSEPVREANKSEGTARALQIPPTMHLAPLPYFKVHKGLQAPLAWGVPQFHHHTASQTKKRARKVCSNCNNLACKAPYSGMQCTGTGK
jgi:hypothetical protein